LFFLLAAGVGRFFDARRCAGAGLLALAQRGQALGDLGRQRDFGILVLGAWGDSGAAWAASVLASAAATSFLSASGEVLALAGTEAEAGFEMEAASFAAAAAGSFALALMATQQQANRAIRLRMGIQ
jgi:hypothetical protein